MCLLWSPVVVSGFFVVVFNMSEQGSEAFLEGPSSSNDKLAARVLV